MSITSSIETVTPKVAGEWLATSKGNRNIYNNVVDRYVRAIKADNWVVNGEAIVFDNTKALVNGHHRCHACIKAGKGFQSLVVRGVDPEAFDTYDSGKTRSAPDVLALQGYQYSAKLSAVLGHLWRYRNGLMGIKLSMSASVQELEEILRIYPEAVSSVQYCHKLAPIASVATMSFIHCLASRTDQYKADQFMDSMLDGANLSQSSPIRALRERWLQQKGRGKAKLSITHSLALSIKAWNYFYENLPLSVLRWNTGEDFPTFGVVSAEAKRVKKLRAVK